MVGSEPPNERRQRTPIISAIGRPPGSGAGPDVIDVYLVLRYRRLLGNALGRARRIRPQWMITG